MIWVDEASSEATIPLVVGEELGVRLRAAPTSGFEWALEAPPGEALRAAAAPRFEGTDPVRRGADALQVFRFAAVRAGATALSFAYRRPFEHGVPPARRFRIDVRVHGVG